MPAEVHLRIIVVGPPSGVAWAIHARFLYLNSGQRAGQADSCWDRRAKVSIAGITRQLLDRLRQRPGARLEARIAGTAPDGGPACATVPLLNGGWQIVAPVVSHTPPS
jgi:hypothetical protein